VLGTASAAIAGAIASFGRSRRSSGASVGVAKELRVRSHCMLRQTIFLLGRSRRVSEVEGKFQGHLEWNRPGHASFICSDYCDETSGFHLAVISRLPLTRKTV
jgi:hypothetical protein